MKRIQMGFNYQSNPFGLVRTICRAFDSITGDANIIYTPIDKNGCAGDPFIMSEEVFYNTFVRHYSSVGVYSL